MWLKVAGPVEPFVAFGDADWPLNFFQADIETPDGDRLVIAFGPDQHKIDPTDVGAAQEVLHRLCPDLKVLDVVLATGSTIHLPEKLCLCTEVDSSTGLSQCSTLAESWYSQEVTLRMDGADHRRRHRERL